MSSSDTARRFFRSAGAAAFSQFWRVGVTFLTGLLLRRFVSPADWGLWDWALPVFLVIGAVRDLGLVYHVVRIKPRPYGNLLAVEAGWGSALVLLTVAGAPLLARGFSDPTPNVVPVIQALSLFILFDGLAAVPRVYFENELRIGRAVLPEILRNLAFAAISISLALLGYGVWSMVVAHVASAALYAAHLWLRARGHIPLHYERGRTLALVWQSLPLALIWFLVILTRYVDPLILALRFPADVVGNYTFAYFVAFLVSAILAPTIARALYPALVAFSDDNHKAVEAYRLATLFVLAIEVPAAMFLFVNSEAVIRILGGGAWVSAPALLLILCWAPLIDPFSRLGGELLKTHDMDRVWIASATLTLISYIGFGFWLSGRLGPAGMAWANFLPLGALIMAWGIWKIDANAFRHLLSDLLRIYLLPAPLFLVIFLTLGDQPRLRFAVSVGAAVIAFALYARLYGPAFKAFLRAPVSAVEDGDTIGA